MLKLSQYERIVCQLFVVSSTMFYKKRGFFKIRLQQHNRVFSFALVGTVFVIRTARSSHPHQCVPSHRLKSTALEDNKFVRWCRTQASSHNVNSRVVVDDRINEAGVNTAVLDRRAVHCCWMHQGCRVAVRKVVAPALQPGPASHLKGATRDVSFLRSDSRCRRR